MASDQLTTSFLMNHSPEIFVRGSHVLESSGEWSVGQDQSGEQYQPASRLDVLAPSQLRSVRCGVHDLPVVVFSTGENEEDYLCWSEV
jgi:hypothetical protein